MAVYRLPGIRCPVCRDQMTCRDSGEINALSRWLKYRCNNDACEGTYWADLVITHEIRPSALGSEHLGLRRRHQPPANDNTGPPAALAR